MTDRVIQEQLLAHYKKHYILLPTDQGVEAAKEYCSKHNIYFGVCYCISALFKISYSRFGGGLGLKVYPMPDWIGIYKRDGYWGRPPLLCETVQEIRSALRLRIDILCKILNLPLNCCFYDENEYKQGKL